MIDFNDSEIGNKLFPNKCPYCGGDILLKTYYEVFGREVENAPVVWVCENYPRCDAYVYGHKETKGEAVKYHPQGIIADEELRSVHTLLRSKVNSLWWDKTINHICHSFIVGFTVDDDTRYGEVKSLDRENKMYTIETETKEIFTVPIALVSKISTRTKVHWWLARQLGISYLSSKIPMFDLEMTDKAIDVIDEALKQVNEPINK